LQEIKDELSLWSVLWMVMVMGMGLFFLSPGFEPWLTGWKSSMVTTDPLPNNERQDGFWRYPSLLPHWDLCTTSFISSFFVSHMRTPHWFPNPYLGNRYKDSHKIKGLLKIYNNQEHRYFLCGEKYLTLPSDNVKKVGGGVSG